MTHVSNALGTINPVRQMIEMAHAQDIPVLVDGAQAVPHCKVDVQALDCDFYAFSGHKMYGPTGIGVLYGKAALLEAMPPYQGGGDMISSVTFEKTTYNKLPYKFEAGTPRHRRRHRAGRGDRIRRTDLGMENIAAHEHELLDYATESVSAIPGVRLIGTAREKAGVLSFVMDGVHPHDIGTILDQRRHRHPHRPSLRAAGDAAFRHSGHGARFVRASTTRSEEVDALVAGHRRKCARCSPDGRSARSLPGSDPGAQQGAAQFPRSCAAANHKAEGYNPLCGDHFTVYLDIDGDTIRDIGFQGSGCAISKASASMMTQSVKGKTQAEAEKLFDAFTSWSPGTPVERPTTSGTGQAGGILRRVGISGAREVRDAGVAHAAGRARRQAGAGFDRIRRARRASARVRKTEEIPMGPSEPITLSRDRPAVKFRVESEQSSRGHRGAHHANAGRKLHRLKSLGGMYRIDAKDADALGISAEAAAGRGARDRRGASANRWCGTS